MRKVERIFVYSLCAASLAVGLRAMPGLPGLLGERSAYAAQPGTMDTQAQTAPAAKIATCDVIKLTQALIESDEYATPRKARYDELTGKLKPMQDELMKMQNDLQALGTAATKPENSAKIKEFSEKREAFSSASKDANDTFAKFFAKQFTEAYQRVADAATEAAHAAGYNYVLSQRSGPLGSVDPQQLQAELVERPVVSQPAGSDLTDVVAKALKIVEKPTTPPAAEGAKPAEPATGTPATTEKPASAPEKPATPEK